MRARKCICVCIFVLVLCDSVVYGGKYRHLRIRLLQVYSHKCVTLWDCEWCGVICGCLCVCLDGVYPAMLLSLLLLCGNGVRTRTPQTDRQNGTAICTHIRPAATERLLNFAKRNEFHEMRLCVVLCVWPNDMSTHKHTHACYLNALFYMGVVLYYTCMVMIANYYVVYIYRSTYVVDTR